MESLRRQPELISYRALPYAGTVLRALSHLHSLTERGTAVRIPFFELGKLRHSWALGGTKAAREVAELGFIPECLS